MVKITVLIFTLFLTLNCFSQTFWRIENERGEELLLTITVNSTNLTFETYTRKDALKEMAGTLMYMMAKAAGKIHCPELMHGEGKISYNSDTTFYNGKIDYPYRIFTLKAKTWKNKFYGLLTDNKNRTNILTGEQVTSDKPLRDYPSLINQTFSLIEKYFWNARLLKSSDWLNYKSNINDLKANIADDYELAMKMMWLGKKLTHIPHEIRKINKKDNESLQKKSYSLKIISEKKAFLNLSNLPEDKEETDQLFKEIQRNNIEILILDARFVRRNMALNSAILLANHLTSQPSGWGVFLTRKWSETEKAIPNPSNSVSLLKNPLELSNIKNSILIEKGFYLRTEPALPIYKGKIYLLIDKWTSNVAETFAIYLKNEKIATLVGQKTAGSPLLNEIIEIDKQYQISIPFAQFYDKNGKNYQGIGVEPDIIAEDAFSAVINK